MSSTELLSSRHCAPCEKGTPALSTDEVERLLSQVPEWRIEDGKLTREVKRRNFQDALDLVNAIGRVAEGEGHHPDLYLHSWNRVRVQLYTHSIGGLSTNDFIVAAKIDRILEA